MKTKQTLVCGLLAVMFILTFGAYSAAAQEQEQRLTGQSDIFKFRRIKDSTAYSIVSAGGTIAGTVTIPAYYRLNADSDYLPVTEIGWEAFSGRRNVTAIIIPSTVTTIGYNVFTSCTGLTSITIPANVTEIGGAAFNGCTSLTNIAFAEGSKIKTIGTNAFINCTSINSITIPASVRKIDSQAFGNWTSSQTIYIEGHANRASTIAAGWSQNWDDNFFGKIVYQGK